MSLVRNATATTSTSSQERGPVKVSPGLAAFDKLLAGGQRREQARKAADDDELYRIAKSLHALERSGGLGAAELLDQLTQTLGAVPAVDSPSLLSEEEEDALREAGSFAENMPPFMERASTVTRLQRISVVASSLTTGEVADLLGLSEGRIRQRATERTLLSVRLGSSLRFPAFQFPAGTEMPGWDRVAPSFPPSAHPVAVATFMSQPSVDLSIGDVAVSPTDWLSGGGESQAVIALVVTAFKVRA